MGLTLKYELKDFNSGKIVNKFNMQKGGSAQLFLSNECFRRMDKYVPKDTGILRTNVRQRDDSITYETPYAHAQYVGFTKGKVNKYTTPGTGPYWDTGDPDRGSDCTSPNLYTAPERRGWPKRFSPPNRTAGRGYRCC